MVEAESSDNNATPYNTEQGSTFNMLYGERDMRGFPVTEHELETVSTFNTQTQIFYSLGAFFISLCISSFWDGVFAESLTPAGMLLHTLGPWIFGIVSACFFFLGWRAQRARRSMIAQIKSQTKHG